MVIPTFVLSETVFLLFYKKTMYDPEKLEKYLMLRFEGEDGIDGGAIRKESFTLALKEMKQRLFEGNEGHVFLVKDSIKSILFKIADALWDRRGGKQTTSCFE